jgi:uncharacterized protein
VALSLLLGALIGGLLGLTGAGGGILAVPALVAGMGWSMQQAAPVALIAVAGGAAVGAIEGLKKGLVRYKAAIVMTLSGLPFTSVGLRIAAISSQRWLQTAFAVVMLVVAARFMHQARAPGPDAAAADKAWARIDPRSGRFRWSWKTASLFACIGALTGFLTGLLGVGGGFVIVPLLRRFTNVSMHGIVATSLMVIALVGSSGVVAAVAHGAILPLPATAFFALATVAGMLLGRRLAARIAARQVQFVFALVLIVVAVAMGANAALAR